LSLASFAVASAQTATPDSENGRYSFNPVADGVLRLDSRTGKVSVQPERCRLGVQGGPRRALIEANQAGKGSQPPKEPSGTRMLPVVFIWLAQEEALIRTRMYRVLHSASAMQAALEEQSPRGARVQMLDSDYGAFLAMARAGMRQATPTSNGSLSFLPRIPIGAPCRA
jgi:hypothetical protein